MAIGNWASASAPASSVVSHRPRNFSPSAVYFRLAGSSSL
jgi:hypothetical protein